MPGSPSSSRRRRAWHSRAEVRLGAVVALLLLGAAVAALVRDGGGDAAAPLSVAFATATATPAPIPTARPAPTKTPSPTATPSPQTTPTATSTPTPTPTQSPSPTPTATATPAVAPVTTTPSLELQAAAVGPGETLLVVAHAPAAASATLEFRGGSYRLVPRGDSFWGVFGIPLGAALGPEPLLVTLRDAAGEPAGTIEGEYDVAPIERPIDAITLTPDEASVLSAEASAREAELRGEQFAQSDPDPAWSEPFQRPVPGIITSPFGVGRSYNGAPVSGYHGGTDFRAEEGSAVLAAGPGRVSWVGEMPIHGNTVIVDHGAGVKTGYHHLSRIDVAVGQTVDTGTQLGAIGHTGLATGPHLHWELTIWGVVVDPMTWISERFLPDDG